MAQAVFDTGEIFPLPSEDALKQYYIGKDVNDVQAPAAVIDLAVARCNCEHMLKTASLLGVKLRAHVKTHKTTQLAQLQVGNDSVDVRLVVSTVAEAEHLLPWLLERKSRGHTVNIIYGVPVTPSAAARMAIVARKLGDHSISFIVDNVQHIEMLDDLTWPEEKVSVLVKIDTGYHRAGVMTGTPQMEELAKAVRTARRVELAGFYSHYGHSYDVDGTEEALKALCAELSLLEEGALSFLAIAGFDQADSDRSRYLLTIGATPTVTASQNLIDGHAASSECRSLLDRIKQTWELELHAGVYPLLDMQQLATRARPERSLRDEEKTLLSYHDLGLRILVEVASIYNDRRPAEALIAAGSMVFGKDSCKSYPGFGVVSQWPAKTGEVYDPNGSRTGWIVGSISQEHGILRWQGDTKQMRTFKLGEKLLIWPNHACMAGPNLGFYLIVDSSQSRADRVVDVWIRGRGW